MGKFPLVTLLVLLLYPAICAQTDVSQLSKPITAEMLKPHVVKLADDGFGGRGAGYAGERKAADYIANQFKRIGLKPIGDLDRGRRTYFQRFKFQVMHPVIAWDVMNSQNVLGLIEGSDPQLKDEIVVIGAHYDGQGRTGQADPFRNPADSSTQDDIWNSANDNATSIASILEIARAIKTEKLVIKRSILFAAFGAEEHGMSGSIYYVSNPVFPLNKHAAMINLEKLGRAPDKPFTIIGTGSSPTWNEVVKSIQGQTKTKISSVPFAAPDSDHYPFSAVHIPSVMFYVSSNLDDAHQSSDTADKIDYERTAEAARFVISMLLDLASRPNRPAFVASPIPDLGLIGHLATSAEADFFGLNKELSGLKVTGVMPGTPAAIAGLQPGDFILEFANFQFHRTDTLPVLMAKYREILEGKRGNNLPVKLLRNRKPMELTVMLRR